MSTRFEGAVALVTGAASGIGAACAIQLAREGARVLAVDIDARGAEKIAQAVPGRIVAAQADVTDAASVAEAIDGLVAGEGRLDIAVNNAGMLGPLGPLHDVPIAEVERVIGVNLFGVLHCMRREIPAMLASGGGVIVNVASVGAESGFPGAGAYCASKHAVAGLTRSAALEYAEAGIRVVAVAPAFVETAIGDHLDPAIREQLAQTLVGAQGIKRAGRPEEISELICFLASPAASFVTGSIHPVDAGYLAG